MLRFFFLLYNKTKGKVKIATANYKFKVFLIKKKIKNHLRTERWHNLLGRKVDFNYLSHPVPLNERKAITIRTTILNAFSIFGVNSTPKIINPNINNERMKHAINSMFIVCF